MKRLIATIILSLLPLSAFAESPAGSCGDEPAPPPTVTVSEANSLLTGLGVVVKEVREAPVQGMWELVIEREGGERSLAYLDFEKRHLMPGPIFDLKSKTLVGGEPARPGQPQRVNAAAIPLKDSIVMGNPTGRKKLIVFTDPDCPYCAKLHWELVRLMYMEPDLAIYIKMFPLKIHPKAYDKARVILGQDSLQLLDKAFAGEELPAPGPKDLAKPVDDSIKLGESLGIAATPTMVLPDGKLISGVLSASEIKKMLTFGSK